ncbi:MAG TPA: Spy/CpxP family protein refolding chaperone [Pyrinomonadaceae bacterium]|nr:Spy/CpxP family protein refolding chaperone [Pyrinomonadaceae bacterium]
MKKIIAGGALAASLMLTGAVGFAQQQEAGQGQDGRERGSWHKRGGKGRHGMRGGFGGRFAEKLNLTDAQKEQMKQIAMRYRESRKALRQQTRENRGGFDALTDGTFNEAAVRAAAQARANARVEREVMRARMMSEMYAVLTPEQKAQLAAERQQWEQKRQERRARRQANPAQNQ